MNTVVVYLDLQSSYKRRKTAKYSCHKVWGLSVVKQLNEKENKMFSKLTQFLRSIVLQEILPTFCGSSILQLFFFCNLSVHPSRLLLCSWLKKRIDIQYKHFNPHPDWSRRKSCNQKHGVRSAVLIKPTCICMLCNNSLTQIYFTHLDIIKTWYFELKHSQSRQICKS